jgi:hypothetical protein
MSGEVLDCTYRYRKSGRTMRELATSHCPRPIVPYLLSQRCSVSSFERHVTSGKYVTNLAVVMTSAPVICGPQVKLTALNHDGD